MPKVSVIVPNYNHAPFLKQRIDSILDQTYPDFELILLDDCSSDHSQEILNTYRHHPKVTQIIFNETNSGSTFRQWEKGIALAKGEYIWIAESDDWAEPEFLSTLTHVLDKQPTAGLAYCDSKIHIEGEKATIFAAYKTGKFNSDHWQKDYCWEGNKEIERALLWDCTINNASAVLLRKSILETIFPFPYAFRFSGDWYCFLRIAAISSIAYTPQLLSNYRGHTSNVSKKAGYDYLVELFYIYNWLWNNKIVSDQQLIIKAFHAYVSDIYASGLPWEPLRDFKQLRPINHFLYNKMTIKLLRRKLRRCFIKTPATKTRSNTNKLDNK
ncbi:glycosyltransferase family 2 protein [Microbacter margulisiae]|uniref:Glycosyltransferase involved in cell wall biosynthesis n=1 Tax=Microbacter margulisiae TaxID=1350067 RepID=A0A7W5DSS6_9PORP|nr:glycosyltransferase [Microbacter margulisiae]MBB3188410.1 glycosyltransferase involved in cell wall biosynthesis [Microbacter margulisiae]